jgi:hypothetical protein
VPLDRGLAEGESVTVHVQARPGTPLEAVLVWTDPPATTRPLSDTSPTLVNDLDLSLGSQVSGDRLNNVEVLSVADPSGTYDVTVTAHHIGFGVRQSYALVITGDLAEASPLRRRAVRF